MHRRIVNNWNKAEAAVVFVVVVVFEKAGKALPPCGAGLHAMDRQFYW